MSTSPHYYLVVRKIRRRGLNLYLALFSADLSEGGLFPVTQSFCRGFLERRAFFGNLLPFLPRYSFPFFVIDPIRHCQFFHHIICIYRSVELIGTGHLDKNHIMCLCRISIYAH
jgi:hypothetical protein